MTSYIKSGLYLIGFMTLSTLASAQFSTDSKSPVTGSADDVDYRPNLTIFSGQVDVRQGDVRILSDKMRVHTTNGASGSDSIDGAHKIEAIGNFYYLTPDQEVRGHQGIYLKSTETFTVTGDVVLLQGDGNVVTGDTLVYNLIDGTASVKGSCQGRKCGSKGRVNILLKNTSS